MHCSKTFIRFSVPSRFGIPSANQSLVLIAADKSEARKMTRTRDVIRPTQASRLISRYCTIEHHRAPWTWTGGNNVVTRGYIYIYTRRLSSFSYLNFLFTDALGLGLVSTILQLVTLSHTRVVCSLSLTYDISISNRTHVKCVIYVEMLH